MSNARLQEALGAFLQAQPALAGFVNVGPLCWLRLDNPSIHPILRFVRMKGASLWGHYGLSVDFVPVIERKRALLKRAPRGAKLDINIDPRDHDLSINCDWGPEAALEDANYVLPEILERAGPFWTRYRTVADLGEAVRFMERHAKSETGLAVENYLQASTARPFLLAAAGEIEEAERHYEQLDTRSFLDEVGTRKLGEQFRRVVAGKLEA